MGPVEAALFPDWMPAWSGDLFFLAVAVGVGGAVLAITIAQRQVVKEANKAIDKGFDDAVNKLNEELGR